MRREKKMMKRKKIGVMAGVIALLIALFTPCFVADAGKSPIDFGDNEINGTIDAAKWNLTQQVERDTKESKTAIFFSERSGADDRAINRVQLQNASNYGLADFFKLETTFLPVDFTDTFTAYENGVRFGVTFGLSTSGKALGEKGSSYVFVEYSGGKYYLGLAVYNETNVPTEVKKTAADGVIENGKETSLIIDVKTSGKIDVKAKIAGGEYRDMFSAENAVKAENGYWGFAQTATFPVRISYFDMYSVGYLKPTNVNVYETFDKNNYNALTLYSESGKSYVSGNALTVADKKLVFRNAGDAYISTKFEYSNVEYAFEITDMLRKGYTAENGNYIPENASFGVMFGVEKYRELNSEYAMSVSFRHEVDGAEDNTVIDLQVGKDIVKSVTLDKKYNIWNEETVAGRSVCVRILVIDGKVTVSLRYSGAVGFATVMNYDVGYSPLGYIRLYSDGKTTNNGVYSVLANMSVDNLQITNYDQDGNVISSEFRSNVWRHENFEYVDEWNDGDLIKGGK